MKLAFWRKKKPAPKAAAPEQVVVTDPRLIGLRTDILPMCVRTYNQDGLATLHNTAFAFEPDFSAAYAAAVDTGSWGGADIHWRAHVICWAARLATGLEGDFVECGTNRGGTAMLVVKYLGSLLHDRQIFLFDTFQGLDQSVSTADEMTRLTGHYVECYEETAARFSPFPNVKAIRGMVPEVLRTSAPEKIAFLHIDLNAAEPERAAIEMLWPRLSPGAPVVFDDYAWVACQNQKNALDEFAALAGVRILSLPTGQGLLFKPAQKR